MISRHPVLKQVMDMLELAYKENPVLNGLIFHTDLKIMVLNNQYLEKVIGNSLDDGLMERFFSILKREIFYGFEKTFKNLDELDKAIKEYIYYYNNKRIKSLIKNHTPIQHRNMVLNQIA